MKKPAITAAPIPSENPNKPTLAKSMKSLTKNPRLLKSPSQTRTTQNTAPTSLAAHATYGEKHRATEILAQVVDPAASEQAVFDALDRGLELIEGVQRRLAK